LKTSGGAREKEKSSHRLGTIVPIWGADRIIGEALQLSE